MSAALLFGTENGTVKRFMAEVSIVAVSEVGIERQLF
jgi:hypothetical protein